MASARSRRAPVKTRPVTTRPSRRAWPHWPDERLLDVRLCDLGLKIPGTHLDQCIKRLDRELDRRGIAFRPHFWLSEEWFTPDGIPGIAMPFYLAHPRLTQLERRQMFEAEGSTVDECMRILRHEVAHAMDHAYLLHRKRRWQQLFGKSSQPYPEYYMPRPVSKRYVHNLAFWYAQSHPDEDFAETFAVWMKPRAVWRKRYAGWPALKKLEYVDEIMKEVAGSRPLVTSRGQVEPLSKIRKTLREHYEAKRARYGEGYPDVYDVGLYQLFSDAPQYRKRESAAAFLRRNRREIREAVSTWTGENQYTLEQVLKEIIGRCRELNLHLTGRQMQVKMDFTIFLTVQTMNFLHSGRHRLAM